MAKAKAKKTTSKTAAKAKPAKAKPVKAANPKTTKAASPTSKVAKKAPVVEKIKTVEKAKAVKAVKAEVVEAVVVEKPAAVAEAAPKATEKPKKRRNEIKVDTSANLESQWIQLQERYSEVDVRDYKMSEQYEAKTPIKHKTLGWGFILNNQNNRLEVLFKDGIKMLISNYKA